MPRPPHLPPRFPCAALLALAAAGASGANPAAAELARLGSDTTVERTLTLSDLGIRAPIELKGADTRRTLYLPVPAAVPLSDARIHFSADYLLPEVAATRLVLALDGDAVSARALTQQHGDAGAELGVDGSPRAGGFVQLGVNWSSVPTGAACPSASVPLNALRIQPDTRLSYRYDAAAIRSLPAAWSALPMVPVILTGGPALPEASYDSAWRIGAALVHAGRHPVLRALPQPGDTVDLDGITVPAGLRTIPAFAALAQGGRQVLRDTAEVGALLALGAGGTRADLLLSDQQLQQRIAAAVEAVGRQAAAAGAGAAFDLWKQRNAQALAPAAPRELRLALLDGRPLIVLGSAAGVRAAAELQVVRHPGTGAAPATAPTLALPLAQLGSYRPSLEVGSRAEWQLEFDLAGAAPGRLPTEAVIDVAAAPAPDGRGLTAAVLLNDVLLGAQRLAADGSAQRLRVAIPAYAPLASNRLRVVFQRPRGGCAGAPVSVLPTSHMVFERPAAADFVSLMASFAEAATLVVPPGYLDHATASLERVIHLAAALEVSPVRSRMILAGFAPGTDRPFLAFEPADRSARGAGAGHVRLAAYTAGASSAGLAVLQVTRGAGQPGIVFRPLGARAPRLGEPVTLAHGALAVLGQGGVLAELDADGSSARLLAQRGAERWRDAPWLLVPCACVLAFVGMLVCASHMRRRKERAAARAKEA